MKKFSSMQNANHYQETWSSFLSFWPSVFWGLRLPKCRLKDSREIRNSLETSSNRADRSDPAVRSNTAARPNRVAKTAVDHIPFSKQVKDNKIFKCSDHLALKNNLSRARSMCWQMLEICSITQIMILIWFWSLAVTPLSTLISTILILTQILIFISNRIWPWFCR